MTDRQDSHNTITAVGAGTPMGNLFRRFWLPALLVEELPAPDGPPVRIRILGEDLIAFRDTTGHVGILGAYCTHKMAPLFFGRNEDCGLRCVYHGWKFNVLGECVDIPNIVPPDNFAALKQKAAIKSYPVQEAGGIAWVYMGPKEVMPELPAMEWLTLPPSYVKTDRWLHRSNWLQAAEGEVDTSHISFLHSMLQFGDDAPDRLRLAQDGAPQITLKETDYGFIYGSRRNFNGQYYWRVTQWMLPMWSAIPGSLDDFVGAGRAWVPIDDYHTTAFSYQYRIDRPFTRRELDAIAAGGGFPPRGKWGSTRLPHGYVIDTFLPDANIGNDYMIDRSVQRTDSYTGIWGINEQDRALQESMPSIEGHLGVVDRSGEHLVKSDLPVLTARRMLTKLARDLANGTQPRAANREACGVRAISMVSPIADFDEFMQVHGGLTRATGPAAAILAPRGAE